MQKLPRPPSPCEDSMKFDDDALRASALSFQLIYRTRGLYQAFACLREFLEGHLPVARINGLYIPADHANVITMVDTLESRPVMVRREGRELPLLLWERLEEPLIVANLDPYKKGHTRGNPAAESLPFLRHHSLARLPVCRNEAYTFVINFWSDEYNAFARDDLTDLRIVTGGFVEELARDLSANLPAMPAHRSLTSGRDKLFVCSGLTSVRNLVEQVAPCASTVLIMGETGAGKESVADAIHELSPRREGPLVKVNCGAIPETLLDSELFGHEKGAFTGAVNARRGYFEAAQGGTIVLDEIGEMSLPAQVRLLRVLESGSISRVGNAQSMQVDVRVIASTHADLRQKVREGSFRKDLWYRLSVFPIRVPPLRERKEDIPTLLRHFLHTKSRQFELSETVRVPDGELARLYAHDWPGNVRELEHVVERAMILARGRSGALHFEIDGEGYRGRRRRGCLERGNGWMADSCGNGRSLRQGGSGEMRRQADRGERRHGTARHPLHHSARENAESWPAHAQREVDASRANPQGAASVPFSSSTQTRLTSSSAGMPSFAARSRTAFREGCL